MSDEPCRRWLCPVKRTTTTLPDLCDRRRGLARKLANKPHIRPNSPEDVPTVMDCTQCTKGLIEIPPDSSLPPTPAADRSTAADPAAGLPLDAPQPSPAAHRDRPGRRAGEGPSLIAQPLAPESETEGLPPRETYLA